TPGDRAGCVPGRLIPPARAAGVHGGTSCGLPGTTRWNDREAAMSGFTVRQALTRDDAQFALRCLASEGSRIEELEAELRDAGIDALLDNPALLRTLLSTPRGAHASLPLFTYVVVRAALRDAGEDDRSLADLVASIVMRFGLRD